MVEKERYIGLGLDTDTAPNKRKTDVYWDAENIHILNNARGLSICPIKGETYVATFPAISGIPPIVVGYVVYNQNIYVFTKLLNSNSRDSVYKIDSNNVITELAWGVFNFSINNRIDAIGNYETDGVIKLYWIDGLNPLRVLNVAITTGYMPKGIDSTFDVTLVSPIITIQAGGALKAGSIQYAYHLFNNNGTQSPLSSLSKLLPVSKYFAGGATVSQVMALSTVVTIDTTNFVYDGIKIYSIHYTELNQSPKISLIYDQFLIKEATSVVLVDDGNTIIKELAVSEFLSITSSNVIPNTIATKRDRLFIANYNSGTFNPVIDTRAYSYTSGSSSLSLKDSAGNVTIYGNTFPSDITIDAINPNRTTTLYQKGTTIPGGTGPNLKYSFYTGSYEGAITTTRSLKQGEIYRVGITLYNSKSVGSPVLWIADVLVPRRTTLTGGATGIVIQLTNTAAFLAVGAMSYQVCIVKRNIEDRSIIAQGFIVPGVEYKTNVGNSVSGLPYIYPYYLTKDIVPISVSNLPVPSLFEDEVPSLGGLAHNQGGDISKDSTSNIDFPSAKFPETTIPRRKHSIAFFYSTDTILEQLGTLPTKIRALGTANCGLSDGARMFSTYTDYVLHTRQSKSGYSTVYGTDGDGSYPDASPNIIFGQSQRNINEASAYSFDIITNKIYPTVYTSGTVETEVLRAENAPNGAGAISMANGIIASNHINDVIMYVGQNGGADIRNTTSYASSVVLQFADDNWHKTTGGYSFSDFDVTNMYSNSSGRAIPIVELLSSVLNQYGGNSYAVRQNNSYLALGTIRDINTTAYTEYIGDVYVTPFSINREEGLDQSTKTNNNQSLIEYVHIAYLENNHNTLCRSDNLNTWKQGLVNTGVMYNSFRMEDNHKLLSVYNQQATLSIKYANPFRFDIQTSFPMSILGSNAKNPNEAVDNWLVFNPNNTKLMEGQFGSITKLHNLAGELVVIQSTGIASLAIEPRIQTQGSDQVTISLGIGSLFYDHRYINTKSGSTDKFTITDDGKTLYYFDRIQNTLNSLQEGKLSTLKTVKRIVDEYQAGPHTTTYFNKKDQIYFQYDQFTLVYDLLLQQFISKYTFLNSNKILIPRNRDLIQLSPLVGSNALTMYTQLTGAAKASKITYMMCPSVVFEKVFHNLEYRLEGTNFTGIKVTNSRNTDSIVSTPDHSLKFDIHRVHLPRVKDTMERWRGSYIIVELTNTGDYYLDDMVLMYNIKG